MSTIHNILLTPKMSAHSLDLHFDVEIDNGGRLKTELHDKLDNFTFTISQFPIHLKQYSISTSVWSLHLTTRTGPTCVAKTA